MNTETGEKKILIRAKIAKGINAAHRSLAIQRKYFESLIANFDKFHAGTINMVLASPLPDNLLFLQTPPIKWNAEYPAEIFKFSPAKIMVNDQSVKGWLYLPNRSSHAREKNVVEFIGPWIDIGNESNCMAEITVFYDES